MLIPVLWFGLIIWSPFTVLGLHGLGKILHLLPICRPLQSRLFCANTIQIQVFRGEFTWMNATHLKFNNR